MSTDEHTLAERVASMITNAVSADAFYFRELDAVAALFREQQAEIERLTDDRASLRRELEEARVELADRREHMRHNIMSGVNRAIDARERGEG